MRIRSWVLYFFPDFPHPNKSYFPGILLDFICVPHSMQPETLIKFNYPLGHNLKKRPDNELCIFFFSAKKDPALGVWLC